MLDADSNFHRITRVMYYVNVFLNFQNPASSICPINHGYKILNGLYDNNAFNIFFSWLNESIITFRRLIKTLKTTMTIIAAMRINL